jgi:hypothetical protein
LSSWRSPTIDRGLHAHTERSVETTLECPIGGPVAKRLTPVSCGFGGGCLTVRA